ncbi:hypothetical protein RCL1_007069 [Eukaryota sp. TZLM3-RCL]
MVLTRSQILASRKRRSSVLVDTSSEPEPPLTSPNQSTHVLSSRTILTHSSLQIPRSCLFQSLLHLLSHSPSNILDSLNQLKFVSKYATVSNFFRSLVFEVISCFITNTNSLVDINKLKFLPLCTSSCLFRLKFNSIPSFLPLDPLRIKSISIDNLETAHLDDLEQDLILLSTLINCNQVEEISLPGLFNVSICLLIVRQFPSLLSLTVASVFIDSTSFKFSSQLCKLSKLVLCLNRSSVFLDQIDVSNMINLIELSITNSSPRVKLLIGLDELTLLCNLELGNVHPASTLHPSVQLSTLTLTNMKQDGFISLFVNKSNFKATRINIERCHSLPDSLYWIYQENLHYLCLVAFNDNTSPTKFSTSIAPRLTSFGVFGRSFDVNLTNSPHLLSLILESTTPRCSQKVSLKSPLYINKLQLRGIKYANVLLLLKKSPYLEYLEIANMLNDSAKPPKSKISLNYLKHMRLISTTGVLSALSQCPRLTFLVADRVNDLDLLLSNYPQLQTLTVSDCPLRTPHLSPNSSLKTIKIKVKESPAFNPNFLALCSHLEYLSLNISEYCGDVSVCALPLCLRLGFFHIPFSLGKYLLMNSKSIKATISGTLLTKFDDFVDATNWLGSFIATNGIQNCRLTVRALPL